jgi:hypothetical protein
MTTDSRVHRGTDLAPGEVLEVYNLGTNTAGRYEIRLHRVPDSAAPALLVKPWTAVTVLIRDGKPTRTIWGAGERHEKELVARARANQFWTEGRWAFRPGWREDRIPTEQQAFAWPMPCCGLQTHPEHPKIDFTHGGLHCTTHKQHMRVAYVGREGYRCHMCAERDFHARIESGEITR